jgi:hypothetical protein
VHQQVAKLAQKEKRSTINQRPGNATVFEQDLVSFPLSVQSFMDVLVNLKSEFASIQSLFCNSTLNQRRIEKLIAWVVFIRGTPEVFKEACWAAP